MHNFTLKLIAVCALVAFGVFYGVEMAKRGIENINGPMDGQPYGYEAVQQPQQQIQSEPEPVTQSQLEIAALSDKIQPVSASDQSARTDKVDLKATGMSRLANKVGGLLQIMAHHGIEWIVSLLERVIH